ncbi:DnaJ family domain-containing protein [Bacillus sp. CGMCC 1.16607]|uniref:DnaJ family domain-containing protein n=1 Tax=Bacillus sp. CGMCC 1.16607 TaxID=3351842 RepID=UPI00363AED3D
MDFSSIVSDHKIRKAYEDGEFENLPGFGQPLKLEDLSGIPEDLRMAYRLMKNAGFSNEENKIKQEMMTIEGLMRNCEDPDEKQKLQKNLNEKLLRFNQVMSKRGKKTNSSMFKNYETKIDKKLFK